uniref:DUF1771 domain-containing protein n=1 Tax=Macrostomum lignano TaxID=282301 RepID=A0A1I8FIM1_9PLAT
SPRLPVASARAAPPQPAVQYEATFDDNDVGNDEFDAGYQHRHGLVRTSAPLPISRETTARELARRAYMRGLNPSHYGVAMDNFEDATRSSTRGLVKDSPTSRQDAILLQLSTIRQGLLDKQKEIETSLEMQLSIGKMGSLDRRFHDLGDACAAALRFMLFRMPAQNPSPRMLTAAAYSSQSTFAISVVSSIGRPRADTTIEIVARAPPGNPAVPIAARVAIRLKQGPPIANEPDGYDFKRAKGHLVNLSDEYRRCRQIQRSSVHVHSDSDGQHEPGYFPFNAVVLLQTAGGDRKGGGRRSRAQSGYIGLEDAAKELEWVASSQDKRQRRTLLNSSE